MASKKSHEKYYSTKDGITSRIYNNMKLSCRARGHEYPNFSLDELREFAYSNPKFDLLFENWLKNGKEKMLIPSLDRTDDEKSYTLDNIRICTWEENLKKQHEKIRKGGTNNGMKRRRRVAQLSLDGFLIKEFDSMADAERETWIKIGTIFNYCNNKTKKIKKFDWAYC